MTTLALPALTDSTRRERNDYWRHWMISASREERYQAGALTEPRTIPSGPTFALPASTRGWLFPSDIGTRRRLFAPEVFAHPAKLHLALLQRLIDTYTNPGETILDPMAGTGSLLIAATQQRNVILRDLMPDYVEMINLSLPRIRDYAGLFAGLIDVGTGDARTLEVPRFDHIITSPPYGFKTGNGISNRRRAELLTQNVHGTRWKRYIDAPNHASFASGFRYAGGQENAGNKSGRNYWQDMEMIYCRLATLLPPEGKLILVIKNHYRRGKLINVVSQTIELTRAMGLNLVARHGRFIDNPSLWQRRRREAGLPIVDVEDVLVFGRAS